MRLRRREDFARLRRQGRHQPGALLRLRWLPNGLAHNRYGIVASRRLGGAVLRNRVRRRLREAARLMNGELTQGMDILLIARMDSATADYDALAAALRELLGRAGLLSEQRAGEGNSPC